MESPESRGIQEHRRRMRRGLRLLALRTRPLRMSDLSVACVLETSSQLTEWVLGDYLQRRIQSPRPLNRPVWPAAYAGESGDSSSGRLSREMMTDAQYAPLNITNQRQSAKSATSSRRWGGNGTYRTSSSPPTAIWKPPSGCLMEHSHFHIDFLSTTS